jgi:hypothetical protein
MESFEPMKEIKRRNSLDLYIVAPLGEVAFCNRVF